MLGARTLRPVADADWDAIASIRNAYEPYRATGEILRQRHALYRPADLVQVLVLEEAMEVTGFCRCAHRESDPEGMFHLSAYVRPDQSGQGLGRALLDIAESFALSHGGKILLSHAEANCPRCLAFAERAGYDREQHLFESRLDLLNFNPAPYEWARAALEAAGFSFGTMADEGDTEETWRHLYDLDKETDRDTPGSENWNTGTFEEYVEAMKIVPGFTLGSVQVAFHDGKWAGINIIVPTTHPGEFQTNYTAVRRQYRGQGLAMGLKLQGLERARAMGGTEMVTNNDERNAPMLAINRKLGFVEKPGFYIVKKVAK